MTDEILINKYLDKNFIVETGKCDFIIYDKTSGGHMSKLSVSNHLKLIFGEFSLEYFEKWCKINGEKITTEIHKYLNSKKIEKLSLKTFKNKFKKYHEIFLSKRFTEFYMENFITSKLEKALDELKVNLETNFCDYLTFTSIVYNKLDLTPTQSANIQLDIKPLITKEIDECYLNHIMNGGFKQFLNELVVTDNTYSGWKVTWIGHGELTESRFNSMFQIFNGDLRNYINNTYDDFISNKIMNSSMRRMGFS
jgi:hypothetical protein